MAEHPSLHPSLRPSLRGRTPTHEPEIEWLLQDADAAIGVSSVNLEPIISGSSTEPGPPIGVDYPWKSPAAERIASIEAVLYRLPWATQRVLVAAHSRPPPWILELAACGKRPTAVIVAVMIATDARASSTLRHPSDNAVELAALSAQTIKMLRESVSAYRALRAEIAMLARRERRLRMALAVAR
jgi:hypothetical protein